MAEQGPSLNFQQQQQSGANSLSSIHSETLMTISAKLPSSQSSLGSQVNSAGVIKLSTKNKHDQSP